jgi:AcrR family transcriptional regulator
MNKRRDETRKKLRDAVVAEVVARGIGSVSIAGIVKRARVSAGTVYVHFESKEHLVREIYMEVKREFHALMMSAGDIADVRAMIRQMWSDMFAFVAEKPEEFLFLEYGTTAKILTEEQEQITRQMGVDIAALLQRGVDDRTLAQLDNEVLTLLLVAPAMQLARRLIHDGERPSPELVELTFQRVWRAIENDNLPNETMGKEK